MLYLICVSHLSASSNGQPASKISNILMVLVVQSLPSLSALIFEVKEYFTEIINISFFIPTSDFLANQLSCLVTRTKMCTSIESIFKRSCFLRVSSFLFIISFIGNCVLIYNPRNIGLKMLLQRQSVEKTLQKMSEAI